MPIETELYLETNMALIDKNSIISTSLYHIDIERNSKKRIPIDLNNAGLEAYLETLLREINEKEEKRLFKFPRHPTTFKHSSTQFKSDDIERILEAKEGLASRLLEKEIITETKYGHLSKKDDTHIKVGSYIQFIYKEDGSTRYLGVKVDHQLFLDETDFKRKAGLGLSEKIYKAVKLEYLPSADEPKISVYDTKAKLTKYWWNDFLELVEQNTDTYNTNLAVTETIKRIGVLKDKFPQDHTLLRNTTIAAFKQNKPMDYMDFIKENIESYTSEEPGFEEAKKKLVAILKELPHKRGFDTKFNLVPSAVPFRKTSYQLTSEISLSIKDGIENIEEKIWSETTIDGRKLVVIESNEADRFVHKQRKP